MDCRQGTQEKMGTYKQILDAGLTRIALIVLLVACYIVGAPAWLAVPSAKSALVHPFFHANIFHLAVNCWSCWLLFRPKGRNASLAGICFGYIAAVAAYLLAIPLLSRAPIGFSNVLMAVCGLSVKDYAPGWWKRQWFISIVAVNLVMLLTPAMAALTHLFSFAIGLAAGQAVGIYRQTTKDYARVSGHNR